ncbi:hypothetical protein XK97_12255 [Obesumbacterium proteus]|uniref:DUF4376 domain-containing protein n=1 Tax=Obesumbacterium proteus TaxID=82983 RepID=UPI00062126D3|nr:DUF4376 domain-containing protein [Obesumbacterium proteus]KKI46747.1 hypothetical protein XK97_12255 [Obesumbacterium proteus]
MKYIYVEPSCGAVLEWIDTEVLNHVLPESVIEVDDAFWQQKTTEPCWYSAGKLITTPRPDAFSFLVDGEWVHNTEVYNAAQEASLNAAKCYKTDEIETYRDTSRTDYVEVEGHQFYSNVQSRDQLIALSKLGAAQQVPTALTWKTKNHGRITMTNELAAQLETAILTQDTKMFEVAQKHIDAVEQLNDAQAIINYDYSQGWR